MGVAVGGWVGGQAGFCQREREKGGCVGEQVMMCTL